MKCVNKKYLLKEAQRTLDESDSTAAFCLCQRWILKNAITLLKEQNQDEKRYTANEVCLALIDHGQNDERFEWGEIIKYTPSEVAKILKGEM